MIIQIAQMNNTIENTNFQKNSIEITSDIPRNSFNMTAFSPEIEKQIAIMLIPILKDACNLYSSYGPSHAEYVEKTNQKINYLQKILEEKND